MNQTEQSNISKALQLPAGYMQQGIDIVKDPNYSLGSTNVNQNPDASNLSNVSPAKTPTSYNSPVSGTATSAISNVNAINGNFGQNLTQSQSALLNTTDANTKNAEDTYNSDKATTQSLIQQYMGQGADQAQMEKTAGVPALQTQSNQLTQQYLAAQNTYNQQYQQIATKTGLTKEQAAQQLDELQRQHGFALTDIGIRQSIAQNDYNNAESLIQHQIQLKYGALKDTITFGQQFLATDANLMSAKEQQSFQANLAVQQQMYTQQTYYAQLNASTSMDMLKAATANNAPSDVVTKMGEAIAQGKSSAEVAAAGAGYTANGNFQPVQTGIDINTGLPIYSGFNAKTGQMEVKNPGNTFGETGSTASVVNVDGQNYQMGATTTMGAYASATTTQVNNINATISKINAGVGKITDPQSAQLAINTINSKSPVTGTMVMSAATQYGVSPSAIIGIMQAETQLGTDGSKGAKQNNWGNVGNTDSLMASGGSVSMTPQAGVDAIARNLSLRQVQSGQNDPAQPTTGQTLTPQQISAQAITNAPTLLQPAMGFAASSGALYLDSSKVPKNLEVIMQSYAASHKVPVLSADQVSVIKGADEAIRNITNVIAPAWQDIAPGNVTSMGVNRILQPLSNIGGTDFYSKNKTFASNKENLAQQIRALSQSAPKGSLLATAESALPNNTGYFNLFGLGGGDTLKEGNMKMQRTLDLLNQTVQSFIPSAQQVTLQTTSASQPAQSYKLNNGTIVTLQADGKTYK